MSQNQEENKNYVLNNLDNYVIDPHGNFVHTDPDMMGNDHFYIAQSGLTSQGHKEIMEKFVEKIIAEKENWALNTNSDYWHRPSGKIMNRQGFASQQNEKLRRELRNVQEIINDATNNNDGDNNIEELMREVEEAIRSQQRMFELIEQFEQRCKESDERLAKELEQTKKKMKEENEKFNKEMDEMFEKAKKDMDAMYDAARTEINQEKTTYRDNPITCEECFFKVEVDDPRVCTIDKKTGKKFCCDSCFSKFIEKEVENEQYEERMKQMTEEIHQTAEQIKKQGKQSPQTSSQNSNHSSSSTSGNKQTTEDWKKESEERQKKWEEQRKQKREEFDREMKNHASESLEKDKEWALDRVENYHLITENYLDEQEIKTALGSNWKNEINNCSSFDEVLRKSNRLIDKLEKQMNELREAKQKAFDDVLESIYSVKEEDLPPHLKRDRWNKYLQESKSLTELKKRQDEINSVINKNKANKNYNFYERSNNRKGGDAEIIIGLLIVGAIVGLIIYLVKRNKNKHD